jgi:misacylated tRNA(Ala) deacylase
MTELIYHTNSYVKQFEAKIIKVDPDSRVVTLDRTTFYPGGGGQPCDHGSLSTDGIIYRVERVKKQGNEILHFIEGEEPLPSLGLDVHGEIDWERRFKLMRTHTGMHV